MPKLDAALAAMRTDADGTALGRARLVLEPTTTWGDVPYLLHVIQAHVLDAEWRQLQWPAAVAGVGLACGLAANVIGALSSQ